MRKKQETVDNTINQGVVSIVSFLKKMSDDNDFMKNTIEDIRGFSEQEFNSIEGIARKLESYLNNTVGLKNKTKSEIAKSSDLINKLTDIESVVRDIYKKIGSKKAKQEQESSSAAKVDTSNIETLSKSLQKLASTVSRRTNVALRRFIRLINTLTSKDMAGQVKVSAIAFSDLANKLSTIGNGLEKADKHMKNFMKGLTVFTLFMISPAFTKSVEVFTKLMDAIHKPKTTNVNKQATQWKWIFMTLALGIGVLVIALTSLENVDWGRALMLVGFLFAVAGAMYLGTRNMRNLTSVGINKARTKQKLKLNNNNSLAMQMLFLSAGLAVLILAIDAIREINWVEAGKLVLFLLAVQAIMVVSDIIIGRKGAGLKGGMGILGFAIGISILLIAIDAGSEVFFGTKPFSEDPKSWLGPWAVVGFIFIMSVILGLSGIGRGNGGVAAQMVKFSLGFAILILAIAAGKELFKKAFKAGEWYGVWGAVGFVILMTFALGKSGIGKGGGGVAAQMVKFAAGLVIMVGALWLLTELVEANGFWRTGAAVILLSATVWGIAFMIRKVTKELKGVKRKQVYEDLLLLAAVAGLGIAVIAAVSLVLLIGVSIAEITGGVLIILGTIFILAYGVASVSKFIENKKLTPAKINKAESMILDSLGLFAIGVLLYAAIAATQKYLEADNAKILGAVAIIFLTMVMALGLVIGVVYITKSMKKKDITTGMAVIAASIGMVFLMSLVYGLLADIQRKGADNKKILGATQVMILTIVEVLALVAIIAGIASTGVGAIFIGVGVALMSAVVGVLLMAAAGMWLIMEADIQKEKIDAFKNSLKDLLLVFTEFSLGDIAIMMVTSVALIPLVFSVALMAGTLLIIQSLNITEENIESFTKSVKSIFNIYTEFGLKDMLKMVGTAVASLPLVLSAAAMAGVLAIISQINYTESSIDLFTSSIKKIFKAFSSFGLKEMLKMAGTATAALPIALTALAMSQVLKNLTEVDVSQPEIDRFTSMVIDFVKSFAQTMEETSEDALKKMKKSGQALVAIVDTAKGFVDVLVAIQGGQIGIYKVDERTGQPILDHFEKFDFDAVSQDAGRKLGKLMGDFATSFTNSLDFTKKQAKIAKKGAEALQSLAPVFDTVAEMISDTEKVKVLTDTPLVNSITGNIDIFLVKTMNSMKSLNDIDVKEKKMEQFKDFISTFSDADKWNKSISAADRFGESVKKVVSNVNGLDLKKAIQFQGIIDSFSNMNNLKNLKEQITEMTEMLKELNKYNENISESSLNIAKNTEQTVKNEEKTNEIVGNLTKSRVTEESLYKIVSQLLTNAMTQMMSDISGNTYDVNVTNKVKIDNKNY